MLINKELLDQLSANAKANPRLRTNICLHNSIEDKVQRMFNAMEPGTNVPIHRHKDASETMLLVRGKMKVMYFDNQKNITNEFLLEANSDIFGLHIPIGTWHGVEVLAEGTVMFEVKEGPYFPLIDEDILK